MTKTSYAFANDLCDNNCRCCLFGDLLAKRGRVWDSPWDLTFVFGIDRCSVYTG